MSLDREKFLVEEVKVIQDVIKRMATNSFSVKTWTITLIVATLLFKGSNNHTLIAFIPLFSFWFLDSYYLQQEKLFRKLYNRIITHRLYSDSLLFDMDTRIFQKSTPSVFRIMFSVSTLPFYGAIFTMLVTYISIVYFNYLVLLKTCLFACVGAS